MYDLDLLLVLQSYHKFIPQKNYIIHVKFKYCTGVTDIEKTMHKLLFVNLGIWDFQGKMTFISRLGEMSNFSLSKIV